MAALLVEAGGAAGAVLAVQPTLQPAELPGLVDQLGAERLLPRPLVGDHRDGRGPDVEADHTLADLIALQRLAVQDKLRHIDPSAPDPGPHDPARPQPAFGDMPGRPPLVGVALVDDEPQHQPCAPLQPATVGGDPQGAVAVLAGQAVQPATLALEPRPPTLAEHPPVGGVEGPRAQHLRLLRQDLLPQPADAEAGCGRRKRPLGEAVAGTQLLERARSRRVRPARHDLGHGLGLLPSGVGPHRHRSVQRGPQAGVVQQPGALKPARHLLGLRRSDPKEDGRHQGRRVLCPLASPAHLTTPPSGSPRINRPPPGRSADTWTPTTTGSTAPPTAASRGAPCRAGGRTGPWPAQRTSTAAPSVGPRRAGTWSGSTSTSMTSAPTS